MIKSNQSLFVYLNAYCAFWLRFRGLICWSHKQPHEQTIRFFNTTTQRGTIFMKKTAREHAQILEERWPLLFNFNESKPLKIKVSEEIYAQINESEWPQIRKALATYAGRLSYLKCLAKGGNRYDLDGNVSGEISEEDIQLVKDKISAHAEKIKMKKKKKAAEKKKKFEANLKKAAKAAQEKAQETEKKTLSIKLPATKKTDNSTVVIKKKRTVIIPEK